jgi:hypothetical protein
LSERIFKTPFEPLASGKIADDFTKVKSGRPVGPRDNSGVKSRRINAVAAAQTSFRSSSGKTGEDYAKTAAM